MNTVGRSPLYVRHILTVPTHRTSGQSFNQSINAIINAAHNQMIHNMPLNPQVDLIRNARKAQFAFNMLRQRIRLRKFPADRFELYAYLFLPIEEVSHQLGVSVELLNKRCEEEGYMWPRGSTARNLVLAVQYTNLHETVNTRRVSVNRNSNFAGVIQRVLPVAVREQTQLHIEIEGRRFGPLLTDEQWLEAVNHPYNLHRINLLAVNHGP